MKFFLRSLRELRGQKSFVLLFCINISFGLVGLGLINTWRQAFEDTIAQRSKTMLGADIQISTRRTWDPKEVEIIEKETAALGSSTARSATLYTMAASSSKSRLIELRATESSLPFYGQITIKGDPSHIKRLKDEAHSIWIYPEIATALGLNVGSILKLGESNFTVTGIIEDDPAGSWAGSSIAPRAYINIEDLQATELVRKGSTVWSSYLVKTSTDIETKVIINNLSKLLNDPGVTIADHRESGEQSARLFKYLTDYLSLVSITALIMTGVAASWLYRHYFRRRRKTTAIYICLGATRYEAFGVGVFQVLFLGVLSSLAAAAISLSLSGVLVKLVHDFVPWALTPAFSFAVFAKLVFISVSTCLVVCLPWLLETRDISPGLLLNEPVGQDSPKSRYRYLSLGIQVLFFAGLAILEAKSYFSGMVFSGTLILATLIILFSSRLVHKVLKGLATGLSAPLKHGLLRSVRCVDESTPAIVSMGLATILTVLLPTLRDILRTELNVSSDRGIPSMFVFDIQDEQKAPLETLLSDLKAQIQMISPMIRGRLLTQNGSSIVREETESQDSRDAERSKLMRNRGYNLSYRSKLDPSEKTTSGTFKGTPFSPNEHELPEISVEKNFADRTKIEMNDILNFEIEGVEIQGKVTSFRSVKWGSFQPNFFVLFQPGVLDDAPKTWVASIGPTSPELKAEIQTKIVQNFPNVSAIDVERVLSRLMELLEKSSIALGALALLCVISGFLVLISITRQMLHEREKDLLLYKVVGADRSFLIKLLLSEISVIAAVSSFTGLFLGLGIAQALSVIVFQSNTIVSPGTVVWIPFLFTFIAVVLSYSSIRRITSRPASFGLLS
ncbi:MAG: FtsX-like permease family protein [Pseudomonadota bacterium]